MGTESKVHHEISLASLGLWGHGKIEAGGNRRSNAGNLRALTACNYLGFVIPAPPAVNGLATLDASR